MTQAEKQKMFGVPNRFILFCMQNVALLKRASVMCCGDSWKGTKIKAMWKQEKKSTPTMQTNHNADLVKSEHKHCEVAVLRAAAQRNWASVEEIFSDQSLRNTPM